MVNEDIRISRIVMMMKTVDIFILLITLSCMKSSIFVVADSDLAVDDTQKIENKGTTSDDAKENNDNNIEDNQPNLPEALVHAARVGAKMRAAQVVQNNSPDNLNNEDNEADDEDEHSREPKPPLTSGCFGTMGCKKVSPDKHIKIIEEEVSTTIHEKIDTDNATTESVGSIATSSKVMGRDWKDRGPSVRKPTTYTDVGDEELAHTAPLGFKLDGRVVTSPSDGLSYFLDAPKDDAGTIPYSYLECGPTIESSTEVFSTLDMVLRHLPSSAQSVSHWANLGGGITIESSLGDGEEEVDDTTRYIDTDGDVEPRPILIVALSPIEVTVSGNNEESRVYSPGSVVLMEDTMGKGHKIKAAPVNDSTAESSNAQDMSLLMVTLPHTIHFPIDWLEDPSLLHNDKDIVEESSTTTDVENGLTHGLFAPKDIHQERRLRRKQTSSFVTASVKKPCPLEYDSAASLFEPTNNQYKHRRSSISSYPAKQDAKLFRFLPSLRRTMLVGIGLSLTSSFMYCVQLLYPPLLVLWGGATMILGGALLNILATRYGYRRFAADWEEEWRWKIEVRRNRLHREELKQQQQEDVDTTLQQSDEKEAESVIKVHTSEDIELEIEARESMEES